MQGLKANPFSPQDQAFASCFPNGGIIIIKALTLVDEPKKSERGLFAFCEKVGAILATAVTRTIPTATTSATIPLAATSVIQTHLVVIITYYHFYIFRIPATVVVDPTTRALPGDAKEVKIENVGFPQEFEVN